MLKLNLLVLRVADIDRAERFYQHLGLVFARERHGRGPEHLVANVGELVLELYPIRDVSTVGVRLGFAVQAIDACLHGIEEVGGMIVTPSVASEWGRRAVVADPDGHHIELLERDPIQPISLLRLT